MKAKFCLAIIATTALLSACGGDHAKVHAVDKIEEAQKLAQEKAPKAEEVKFADHGEVPMGGVGGAGGVTIPAPTDTQADKNAQATTEPTDTKTPAPAQTDAPADAPAPADAKTDQAGNNQDAKVASPSASDAPAKATTEPAKAQ